jgi:hypothetical protein
MDLKLCEDVDWIHLAKKGRDVASGEHGNEHLGPIKGGEIT